MATSNYFAHIFLALVGLNVLTACEVSESRMKASSSPTKSKSSDPSSKAPIVSVDALSSQPQSVLSTNSSTTNGTTRPPTPAIAAGNSCSDNSVYSTKYAKCMSLPIQSPIADFSISQWAPPVVNSTDNYAYGTASVLSNLNYGRTLNDLSISSDDLRVTSSVALAGAITSIRFKNFELIASGGHGASMQVVSHDWVDGGKPDECNNPTEAGNSTDDNGQAFPYHGPSSSYIVNWDQYSSTTMHTVSSLADYIPPGSTSHNYGYGSCTNYGNAKYAGRGVYLTKKVEMNPYGLRNSFLVDAQVQYPMAVQNADITFVAYLSRYFQKEYIYSPSTDLMVEKLRGMARKFEASNEASECFSNVTQAQTVARIFSSSDSAHGMAVAMMVVPALNSHAQGQAINYTATESDFLDQTYLFRNVATQQNFKRVTAWEALHLKTIVFVGSFEEVKGNILKYCAVTRNCVSGDAIMNQLSSKVFDWREYLSRNPDLKSAGIRTQDQAASHWLQYGLREGRVGSAPGQFWTKAYLAKNPDVLTYVLRSNSIDYCRAIGHYFQYGMTEGREY